MFKNIQTKKCFHLYVGTTKKFNEVLKREPKTSHTICLNRVLVIEDNQVFWDIYQQTPTWFAEGTADYAKYDRKRGHPVRLSKQQFRQLIGQYYKFYQQYLLRCCIKAGLDNELAIADKETKRTAVSSDALLSELIVDLDETVDVDLGDLETVLRRAIDYQYYNWDQQLVHKCIEYCTAYSFNDFMKQLDSPDKLTRSLDPEAVLYQLLYVYRTLKPTNQIVMTYW